jgi:hypothetical protein
MADKYAVPKIIFVEKRPCREPNENTRSCVSYDFLVGDKKVSVEVATDSDRVAEADGLDVKLAAHRFIEYEFEGRGDVASVCHLNVIGIRMMLNPGEP